MRRITLVILTATVSLVLFACAKTENTSNSNSNANKTAGSAAPANTSKTSTAASAGDKIGVPECDDYIAKYESCLRGKVPEMAKAQLESSLKTARENWKRAAENASSRGTLAAACKQASDAAAASMKAYGCTF